MKKGTWALVIVLIALLAIGFAIVGCGGTEETTTTAGGGASTTGTTGVQPTAGGTMSYYLTEPSYIDPYNVQENQGTQVTQALYDGLVTFNPTTSKIEPAVAESWTPNADATEFTFKLRSDVKFSDGTPVTAKNFKYGWERILTPGNKSDIAYHLEPVKGYQEMLDGKATELSGVVAKDDTTLVVTLNYSFADFPYVTGHPALSPVPLTAPKDVTTAAGKKWVDMPIGNGPFMMAEPWKHDQFIKLVKNPNYYGKAPYLDGVDFRIMKDEQTAFNEFKAGNLDFTESIPTGQIQATFSQYGLASNGYTVNGKGQQALNGSELSTYYVWINTTDPILKDKTVRKAIASAINYAAIAQVAYEGTRQPISGAVPPGIVGYQDNAWPANKYDVENAKKLLSDSGHANGAGIPELALSFNSGSGHEKVMQLIQADLQKVGIKTKFDPHEWAEYSGQFLKIEKGKYISTKKHNLMRLGWLADYPIMDNFLFPLFQSTSSNNEALYNNPAVDKALEEARSTTDEAQRIAKYQAIEKMVGEDQPLVSVVGYRHKAVASERLRDFTFSTTGLGTFQTAWLAK